MRPLIWSLLCLTACAEPSGGVADAVGSKRPGLDAGRFDVSSDLGSGETAAPDAGSRDADSGDFGIDAMTRVDRDRDGLDDRDEARWAQDYLPFLSVAANDRCPLAVGLYRIRPHPLEPDLLHYLLILLFE